jgi:molybdenum cofactor cytidylyltransferase
VHAYRELILRQAQDDGLFYMNNILIAILAAGESRRMGHPKLSLSWGGTSILGHLLQQWREAGAEKIVVIHPQGEKNPVVLELDRLGIAPEERIVTFAPERGMMGSIVTAAQQAIRDSSLTHLVIALGDQPHLQTETLRLVLHAGETAPKKIVRTVFQGKPGHPVALPVNLLAELADTPAATLRDFISLHQERVFDLACADSGVLLDIDTPEDYAHASQRTTHQVI